MGCRISLGQGWRSIKHDAKISELSVCSQDSAFVRKTVCIPETLENLHRPRAVLSTCGVYPAKLHGLLAFLNEGEVFGRSFRVISMVRYPRRSMTMSRDVDAGREWFSLYEASEGSAKASLEMQAKHRILSLNLNFVKVCYSIKHGIGRV